MGSYLKLNSQCNKRLDVSPCSTNQHCNRELGNSWSLRMSGVHRFSSSFFIFLLLTRKIDIWVQFCAFLIFFWIERYVLPFTHNLHASREVKRTIFLIWEVESCTSLYLFIDVKACPCVQKYPLNLCPFLLENGSRVVDYPWILIKRYLQIVSWRQLHL